MWEDEKIAIRKALGFFKHLLDILNIMWIQPENTNTDLAEVNTGWLVSYSKSLRLSSHKFVHYTIWCRYTKQKWPKITFYCHNLMFPGLAILLSKIIFIPNHLPLWCLTENLILDMYLKYVMHFSNAASQLKTNYIKIKCIYKLFKLVNKKNVMSTCHLCVGSKTLPWQ